MAARAPRGAAMAQAAARGPGVDDILAEEAALGVEDPAHGRRIAAQRRVPGRSAAPVAGRAEGGRVHRARLRALPQRAVALLCHGAGVDRSLLGAVADASPAKHGRRMPATDIPVVALGELVAARPGRIALFLPDLLREMRGGAAGGRGRRRSLGSTWRRSAGDPEPLTLRRRPLRATPQLSFRTASNSPMTLAPPDDEQGRHSGFG